MQMEMEIITDLIKALVNVNAVMNVRAPVDVKAVVDVKALMDANTPIEAKPFHHQNIKITDAQFEEPLESTGSIFGI